MLSESAAEENTEVRVVDQVKIGIFIAELRRENKMTQETLGQRIGVTNKTVSRWETGRYLPDIEMLRQLSSVFHVGINELLCGERLSDGSLKRQADENLAFVRKNSAFSVTEYSEFWKKKWLGEHTALIFGCTAAAFAAFLWACKASAYWLAGACPLGWLALFAVIRNRMMGYVESKVYSTPERYASAPEKHVFNENLHADYNKHNAADDLRPAGKERAEALANVDARKADCKSNGSDHQHGGQHQVRR